MRFPKTTKAVPYLLIATLVVASIVISFEINTMTLRLALKVDKSIRI